MTKLVFQIPNAIYLPNSEAIPDFDRYVSEINCEATGVEWIIAAASGADSTEVATIYTADYLIELLEEGGIQLADASEFVEADLCTIDAQLYSWLKRVNSYKRLGLQECDEDNPSPEVFVFTSDYD